MYKKLSILLLLGGCTSYGWYNPEVNEEQALIDANDCKIIANQQLVEGWRDNYWKDEWRNRHDYYRYDSRWVERRYYQVCLQSKGYRYIQIK